MRGGCFCRPSRLWGSLCCGLSSAEQIVKGTASARRRWPAMSLERLVLWCQPNRVSEVFSSDRVSPGCRHVLGHWNRRRRHRSRRHCHSRPSCARVGFAGVVACSFEWLSVGRPEMDTRRSLQAAVQTQRRVWVAKGSERSMPISSV